MNDYELYHHGVKGMKWGVRRYQNKDGSLTDAGQKRLVKSIQKTAKTRSARKNMVETTSKKLKEELEREESFKGTAKKLNKHASDFERLLDESYAAKSKKESDRLYCEAEKAWNNYVKERNQAVDSLLGKYADTQIKNVSRNRRSISDARLITTYAIDDLSNWRFRGLN